MSVRVRKYKVGSPQDLWQKQKKANFVNPNKWDHLVELVEFRNTEPPIPVPGLYRCLSCNTEFEHKAGKPSCPTCEKDG